MKRSRFRSTRSSARTVVLAMCVALLGANALQLGGAGQVVAMPPVEANEVEGTGWKSVLACMGCIGVGIGLVATGGWAAVVGAAAVTGSTLGLATCIFVCEEAVFG